MALKAGGRVPDAFCDSDRVLTVSLHETPACTPGEDGALEQNAKELDIYYVSGRYPDAFPEEAPFELLIRSQAEPPLAPAEEIVAVLRGRMAEP